MYMYHLEMEVNKERTKTNEKRNSPDNPHVSNANK